jgi:hypothetical protein
MNWGVEQEKGMEFSQTHSLVTMQYTLSTGGGKTGVRSPVEDG